MAFCKELGKGMTESSGREAFEEDAGYEALPCCNRGGALPDREEVVLFVSHVAAAGVIDERDMVPAPAVARRPRQEPVGERTAWERLKNAGRGSLRPCGGTWNKGGPSWEGRQVSSRRRPPCGDPPGVFPGGTGAERSTGP